MYALFQTLIYYTYYPCATFFECMFYFHQTYYGIRFCVDIFVQLFSFQIQSRNDWQKKVECSGVSIKEATDFRLEDEGVCEKIDENTWKVTKPLKIRLVK